MNIEFDPEKAAINPINHEGVTFEEAQAVLLDPFALTREDGGYLWRTAFREFRNRGKRSGFGGRMDVTR